MRDNLLRGSSLGYFTLQTLQTKKTKLSKKSLTTTSGQMSASLSNYQQGLCLSASHTIVNNAAEFMRKLTKIQFIDLSLLSIEVPPSSCSAQRE